MTEQTPAVADETPNPAVTRVLHAMTDRLHESLCNCRAYPDSCASRDDYRRDSLMWTFGHAEEALGMAIEQGWIAEPSEEITRLRASVEDSDRLLGRTARRLADVLGLDLKTMQLDDLIARAEQLRARDAAWKAYAELLSDRLWDISSLVSKPAMKCSGLDSDVVQEIDDLANTAGKDAVLAETPAPTTTEGDQTPRRPVHADPDFGYEYDEDGAKTEVAAGWDISFGCRLNVVQDRDGLPYVSVHLSDHDLRNGFSSRSTTREQIRQFAYHLLKLTEEMDEFAPSSEDTPADTPAPALDTAFLRRYADTLARDIDGVPTREQVLIYADAFAGDWRISDAEADYVVTVLAEDTPAPRVWREGDDEPEGVDLLRDTDDGHRAFPFARRNTDGRWCWVKSPDESPEIWHGLPWKELLADAYGPLSEVPAGGGTP